eukprot:TRINITY_DN30423_c0_g1_i1.p1 TRINITY_DN30423_c0_g1~~TRINITY_DN30423_c0_g1_i1.p1  ORF type:complete len:168 (+),score=27.25 TRINITY_DN30423_c0_g1_i1:52-504(+)
MDAHIDKELARLREERMEEVYKMQREKERSSEEALLQQVVNGLAEISLQMKGLQEKQAALQETVMLLLRKRETRDSRGSVESSSSSPSPYAFSSSPQYPAASPLRESAILTTGPLADIIRNSTTVSRQDEERFLKRVAVVGPAMTPPRRL